MARDGGPTQYPDLTRPLLMLFCAGIVATAAAVATNEYEIDPIWFGAVAPLVVAMALSSR